nr:hypothetical protein [uncultured Flavobacterium sp.]
MNTRVIERVEAELTPIDMEQRVIDMLDECYDEVKIGGLTFSPSEIVQKLDPIAFRCMVSEESDADGISEEINGEYYDADEVQAIIDEVEEEEAAEAEEEESEEEAE